MNDAKGTDTKADETKGGEGALTGGDDKGKGGAAGGKDEKKADVQTSGQKGAEGALTGDDSKDEGADKKDAKGEGEKKDAGDDAKLEVKFGDLPVEPKFLEKFTGIAKELKLDNAGAQKMADLYVEARKQEEQVTADALAKQDADWLDKLRGDKEIGGADHKKHVLFARKALAKFGTPELKALINGYGLANNPELVRVFARIGKADAEDTILGGEGDGASTQLTETEQLRQRYPKSFDQMNGAKRA